MVVDNANDFIRALEVDEFPADSTSVPRGILMVEPEGFYVGEETALDNHYMNLANAADPERVDRAGATGLRAVSGSLCCMVVKIF